MQGWNAAQKGKNSKQKHPDPVDLPRRSEPKDWAQDPSAWNSHILKAGETLKLARVASHKLGVIWNRPSPKDTSKVSWPRASTSKPHYQWAVAPVLGNLGDAMRKCQLQVTVSSHCRARRSRLLRAAHTPLADQVTDSMHIRAHLRFHLKWGGYRTGSRIWNALPWLIPLQKVQSARNPWPFSWKERRASSCPFLPSLSLALGKLPGGSVSCPPWAPNGAELPALASSWDGTFRRLIRK